jgi:glycosyltransferase involved in cell wall biosynthesis
MGSCEIKISVALVTRNRPESLRRTLTSLRQQEFSFYEIIISDDSDNEELAKLNCLLASEFNCFYFRGPQNGLYANRNFVAKMCKGTHIRTMDDDHEFPSDHFLRCREAISRDPHAIWTIGEYYPYDQHRPLPAPVPGQLHPRGYSYPPKKMDSYFGISCGASIYPKTIIDKKMLNSEAYLFGILYLEYGAKLVSAGCKIKYIDNTYVIHHYDPQQRSFVSSEINSGARLFSMFLLSFRYQRTVLNKMLTIAEVAKGLLLGQYSLKTVRNAYDLSKYRERW